MTSYAKRVSALLAFGLAALTEPVVAAQTRNPLRVQLNSDVFRLLFSRGDQRMLDAFKDVELDVGGDEECLLGATTVSIDVAEGVNVEDYDFTVSLNEHDYLGFEGKDLRVIGSSTLGEQAVTFEAPLDKLRLSVEFVAESDEDVLAINANAERPSVEEFAVELGDLTINEAIENKDKCAKLLQERAKEGIYRVYDELMAGDIDRLTSMPVESFIPMIVMRSFGSFAREQVLDANKIEFGFDPEMLFERVRPAPKKKASMLKAIDSTFSEPVEGADPTLASLILDENFINSFIYEFVLVDRAFSLREFLKTDPRMVDVIAQMNTEALAIILPSIIDEYGENRQVDVYFSLSHALVSKKLDGAKATGFQMDKNGNFRLIFNISFTVLVEKEGKRNQWEEARSMYFSFMAKGKVAQDRSGPNGERLLTLTPKTAEISQLKIFNAEDEEQTMEQMVIVSGFNVQMERALKMIPPIEQPMVNIPTPKELECLGLSLADLNVNFKKGYVEVSCGYKEIEEPSDPDLCETFLSALREGPRKAQEGMDGILGGLSAKDFIEEKKQQFEKEYERLVDDKKADGDEDFVGDGDAKADDTVVIEDL